MRVLLFLIFFVIGIEKENASSESGNVASEVLSVEEIDLQSKKIIADYRAIKEKPNYHSSSEKEKNDIEKSFLSKMGGMESKIDKNVASARKLAEKKLDLSGTMSNLSLNIEIQKDRKNQILGAWARGDTAELSNLLGSDCAMHSANLQCGHLNPYTKDILGIPAEGDSIGPITIDQVKEGYRLKEESLQSEIDEAFGISEDLSMELRSKYGFKGGDLADASLRRIAAGSDFSSGAFSYFNHLRDAEREATFKMGLLLNQTQRLYDTLYLSEEAFNKKFKKTEGDLAEMKSITIDRFKNSVLGSAIMDERDSIVENTLEIICMGPSEKAQFCNKSITSQLSDMKEDRASSSTNTPNSSTPESTSGAIGR